MTSIRYLFYAVKKAVALLDVRKKGMLLVLLVLSLLTYVVSVVTPTLEMFIADGVVGAINDTNAVRYLYIGIVGLAACSALGFLSRKRLFVWSNYVGSTISDSIYKDMLQKSAKIKYKYYEDKNVYEDIAKTASTVPDKIASLMTWSTIPPIIGGTISMIAVSISLVIVDWKIAVLVLLGNVLSIFFYYKRMRDNYYLKVSLIPQKRWADAYWDSLVNKNKLKEVKFFRLFDYIADKWERLSFKMQKENMKLATRYSFILLLTDIVAIAFKSFALIYTVYLVVFGDKSIGVIMLVYGSINVFNGYMSDISRAFINLGENSLYIKNWIDYMELEEESSEETIAATKTNALLKLSDVSFRYPKTDTLAIDGVSVEIHEGEKIAIVGENGSGKSTFVNLINGLFDDYEGTILFDGKEIRGNLAYLRQNVATIFQDFGKYDFTIRENIAMGDIMNTHSEKDIWEAAEKADAQQFISELDNQMDTMIGPYEEGTYLSGGQWQKVAIGRTFLKDNAKIVILDEPTAALDPYSESEAYRRFLNNVGNQATLLISHRLGATRYADRILVFDKGKIVEEGNHEELMAQKGLYRKMYIAQASLYAEKMR